MVCASWKSAVFRAFFHAFSCEADNFCRMGGGRCGVFCHIGALGTRFVTVCEGKCRLWDARRVASCPVPDRRTLPARGRVLTSWGCCLPACVPDRLGAFAAVLCCGPAAAPPPQPCLHLARAACGRCLVWPTFKLNTLDLFVTSLGRVRRLVAQGFICFRPPSWPIPIGALGGGWASRVPGGLALVCGMAGGLRQG